MICQEEAKEKGTSYSPGQASAHPDRSPGHAPHKAPIVVSMQDLLQTAKITSLVMGTQKNAQNNTPKDVASFTGSRER